MIRILQVVNNMHRAGLETILMNYYRNIDRKKYQFDFLVHRSQESDYDGEILKLGGQVYRAPRLYPQNYPMYFKHMKDFFKIHKEYKIIHSHIDAMSYLPLLAAKKAEVPIRISHSHNTSIDVDWKYPLKKYFCQKIPNVATHYCSCGEQAGEFLFPSKDFTIIPNAIDMNKFVFNSEIRCKTRRNLGINDNFVVGHVGRFSYAKNHERVLKIFTSILKKEKNAILLLIGEGEKEKKIHRLAKQCGLNDKIIFLGKRDDVNKLYQAMDVFLLPSLFEGIPVVGIEAQCSGLCCVFSDKVPQETKISNNCRFVSLDEDDDVWAETIVQSKTSDNKRLYYGNNVYNSKYNVEYAVNILTNYYEKLYNLT